MYSRNFHEVAQHSAKLHHEIKIYALIVIIDEI